MVARRYLIYCRGGYQRTSAGSAVLNRLCHELNEAGQESYMSSTNLNPAWHTLHAPAGLQEEIARQGVVVYPEVQAGNCLEAAQVVRYVLNVPGLLGGDRRYKPGDRVFVYSSFLNRYVPDPKWLLHIPIVDTSLFNSRGASLDRSERCFYVGKGIDKKRLPDFEAGAVEITRDWPESHAALAELFRTAELFITYDDYTNLIDEARLCGCPVLIIGGRADIYSGSDSLGVARRPEEIKRTRAEVKQYADYYQDSIVKQWPDQLRQFVEVTQTELVY